MLENSGKRYETDDTSAPLSRYATTVFPESIIDPKLGHELFVTPPLDDGFVGLYILLASPVDSNACAYVDAGRSSELTIKSERTSFGLASTQLLIWPSQYSIAPPWKRSQDVWQRSMPTPVAEELLLLCA